jgi:glycosyltransferase involved in cell wall biosynthesis
MIDSVFAACVVIPVFNHEHAIASVVDRVRTHGLPVILVDDGSDAACARELQRLAELPDVMLLRHDRNRGKGAALVTGLRAARQRGFTHVLQVDADGQHTLGDIRRFVEEARNHPGSLICGAPLFDSSMPTSRRYGRPINHAMVWLETLSFDIVDSMCGFRVYPLAPTLALLDSRRLGPRMEFDTEILVRLHWRDVPMRWLPTRVSYPQDGVSHYRVFFDNVHAVALHVRLLAEMLVRLPVLLWKKSLRTSEAQQREQNRNANA